MALDEKVVAESERLTLRVYEPADSADLFAITGSPETMRLMPRGLLEDEAAVSAWIDRRQAMQDEVGYSIWAVVLRSTGRLIGNCGFARERDGALELGYVLDHRRWGHGYATEAASTAVGYAVKHLAATSIVSTIRPGNDPSIAVANRLGMEETEPTTDEHGALLVFRMDV